MNPALVMFGVRSVIRLGRVSREALQQSARDDEAIFPSLESPGKSKLIIVNGFFNRDGNTQYVSGEDAPYAEYWDQDSNKAHDSLSAVDALYSAAVKIEAEEGGDLNQRFSAGSAVLLRQWAPGTGPLSPWARIVLTAGDIALEYVGANPAILGTGKGDKLIAAYAANLAEILPDDGELGPRHSFGQRLTGAFLHAGLSTINDNPQGVVSQEHMQKLISASVQPLVDAFPDSLAQQLRWSRISEALVGPAASAALQTVADNPQSFLGSDFSADEAIGAVTQALLREAAETGIELPISRDGLLGLYRAALNVAAQRPALFLGDDEGARDAIARDLLSRFAGDLAASPPPFDGEVGIELARAAIAVVGANAHRLADDADPWQQVAVGMVTTLTDGMSTALGENSTLGTAFSRAQLSQLGRALLDGIAENPGMVLGSDRQAWSNVVSAVATAMRQDSHLLLSGDDWIEIARVVAAEAAANPGRLFGLDPGNQRDTIAAGLISTILRAAASIVASPQQSRAVLFGRTLREAISIAVRATSGNPQAALQRMAVIAELVSKLNLFVAEHARQLGSKEWLNLFRVLLGSVLDGQDLPELSLELVDEILRGGA